ncbi:MAG: transglycosylase domain-containing protein [Verrucomicrobiota bacterium JB023]|nr:transglycosylase domain-containing protein [Verrucomicrobiota bacterium JB023]
MKHRKILQFRTWPKWVRFLAFLTLFCGFIAVLAVAAVTIRYAKVASAYDLEALNEMKVGARVAGKNDDTIGRLFVKSQEFVAYDDVSPNLINAIVATEDSRFFSHGGIDLRGIARAAVANAKAGRIRQGGSTITQQLVRHVYGLRGRNYDRKMREVFVSNRIERRYSKEEILQRYLNHIYLGSGFYGVASASKGYFGKSVSNLSVSEAALLASVIKLPAVFSPFVSEEDATAARNRSLVRMFQCDFINREQLVAAREEPLGILPEHLRFREANLALQAVKKELADIADPDAVENGVVHTTVDTHLQEFATKALADRVSDYQELFPAEMEDALEGGVVVLENESGNILAHVGSIQSRNQFFDRILQARRPAGTAFLPISYSALLDPNKTAPKVLDAPLNNGSAMVGGTKGILGEWGESFDQYEGMISPEYALLNSKLSATVRLSNRAGVHRVLATSRTLGIDSPLRPYVATALGESSIRPIELAQAYATLACEGTYRRNGGFIDYVLTADNDYLKSPRPLERIELSAETRHDLRQILVARMDLPEYRSHLAEAGLMNRGLAGFSGSSYGQRDAWFIGFDREITCLVWLGSSRGEEALLATDPGKDLAMPVGLAILAEATDGEPKGWDRPRQPGPKVRCLVSGGLATEECFTRAENLTVFSASRLTNQLACGESPNRSAQPNYLLAQEKEPEAIMPRAPLVRGTD